MTDRNEKTPIVKLPPAKILSEIHQVLSNLEVQVGTAVRSASNAESNSNYLIERFDQLADRIQALTERLEAIERSCPNVNPIQ